MAHRFPLLGLVFLFAACGGRESGDSSSTPGTSGGGGGSVAVGTGGSSGTVGTGGSGGPGAAGQSGDQGRTCNGDTGYCGTGGQGQGGADWTSCTSQDTCVLEPIGSCGPGCEPVLLNAFTAVNSASAAAYTQSRPPLPCAAIACPIERPGDANAPNFYAACESGTCQPIDVRHSPLSACTSDSDCSLRSGTTCCGCGNGDLIAVSNKANVEQVFCGAGRACAADCVAAPLPPGVLAVCEVNHCVVHYPTN